MTKPDLCIVAWLCVKLVIDTIAFIYIIARFGTPK